MTKYQGENSNEISSLLSSLAKEDYCYLSTIGRVSERIHEIEIWFVAQFSTLYLLAGDHKSDWVKNLLRNPSVTVRIARYTFTGTARLVKDKQEEMMARTMLAEKYQEWEEDKTLSNWARTALVVGIDLRSLKNG